VWSIVVAGREKHDDLGGNSSGIALHNYEESSPVRGPFLMLTWQATPRTIGDQELPKNRELQKHIHRLLETFYLYLCHFHTTSSG
jgi:hypothetical protein